MKARCILSAVLLGWILWSQQEVGVWTASRFIILPRQYKIKDYFPTVLECERAAKKTYFDTKRGVEELQRKGIRPYTISFYDGLFLIHALSDLAALAMDLQCWEDDVDVPNLLR